MAEAGQATWARSPGLPSQLCMWPVLTRKSEAPSYRGGEKGQGGRCSDSWDLIHYGHTGTRLPDSGDRSQQRDFYSFLDRIGKRMILKEGLHLTLSRCYTQQ